jgi:hypothetical protein
MLRHGMHDSVVGSPSTEAVTIPFQQAEALSSHDFRPFQELWQWSVQQCGEDPFFSSCVLFTGKAGLAKEQLLNFLNRHIWSDVTSHSTIQSKHQQFSINV